MQESNPDEITTLTHLPNKQQRWQTKTAIIERGRDGKEEEVTYEKLAFLVDRTSASLRACGVANKDKIILLGPNSIDWMVHCLASFKIGAVVVPVNVQSDDKTLKHIVKDSGARFIFTTDVYRNRLRKLSLTESINIMMLENDFEGRDGINDDQPEEGPATSEADTAAIFYTSGTTGMPKGVPLSHRNLCHQINYCANTTLGDSDQVVLLPLPLHHIYPFSLGFLLSLHVGATLILPHSITGPSITQAIKENSVTTIIGVPRLYSVLEQGIASRIESRSLFLKSISKSVWWLSTIISKYTELSAGKFLMKPIHAKLGKQLKLLACGGAAIDPELLEKLEGLGWKVLVGYGLSETSPLVSINWSGAKHSASAGQPIDGCNVRIGDIKSKLGNENEIGEVEVRGPNVFSGYHNLPEKTNASFTDDGWFKTGDLGTIKNGLLYLKGRKSTVLVTDSGENIQVEKLESVYEESPLIKGCGILKKNGKLVGVIVPGHSAGNSKHEVEQNTIKEISKIEKNLASYERMSDFNITSKSLPRTRLGKIRRKDLSKLYDRLSGIEQADVNEAHPIEISKMSSEDQILLRNENVRRVWKLLAEKYDNEELTPDTNLSLDLGIDSLAWVNLTLEISNKTGLQLSENNINKLGTVRDLLECCEEKHSTVSGEDKIQIFESPEDNLQESQKRWLEPVGPLRRLLLFGVHGLGLTIAKLYFRLNVEGVEHLKGDKPLIIAPNHSSYLDPFVLGVSIPFNDLKNVFWAGYEGIAFANALARFGSRTAQGIPIDPYKDIVSSLSLAACVLRKGNRLVWFPEGERSHTGKLVSFKQGIGLLCDRLDIPVLPVYIEGAYEALPPGSIFPKPVRITIRFGEVKMPGELMERGSGEKQEKKIVSGLKAEIQEMIDNNPVNTRVGSNR